MYLKDLIALQLITGCLTLVSCSGDAPPEFEPRSTDTLLDSDVTPSTDTNPDTDNTDPSDTETTIFWDSESETEPDTSDKDSETATDTNTSSPTSWWNCDYTERREVTVSEVSEIEGGHSLKIVFDHQTLVKDKLSKGSGDDVRVLYWDGQSHRELSRVVDPLSNWNRVNTTIWCGVPDSGLSLNNEEKIFIYYGNSGANNPPNNEGDVFHFADFFNRKNSTNVDNGWTIYEGVGTNIEIKDNSLYFENTANAANRPGADHPIEPLLGRLRFRFGFDWSLDQDGGENVYRLHIQLGRESEMEATPGNLDWDHFSNAGVGPSLLWASPNEGMDSQEGFGFEVDQSASEMAVVSGMADIEIDVDIPGQQYKLFIDGKIFTTPCSFSQAIDSIDMVRLFTWQMSTPAVEDRFFHYIIVEKTGSLRPVCSVGTTPSNSDYSQTCPGK